MQDQIIEQVTSATQNSYEALQELGRINSETVTKLAELQFTMASLGIESSVEQARLLTSTANYQDLLSAESDFARSYSDKIMGIARQTADILTQSRDEVTAWIEKSTSNVTEIGQTPKKKPAARKPAAKKPAAKKTAASKA